MSPVGLCSQSALGRGSVCPSQQVCHSLPTPGIALMRNQGLHKTFAAHGLSLVVVSGGYSSSWWWASHCGGHSCGTVPALDCESQQCQHTGLAAPQRVGSSRTRNRTHIPCTGRWILNYWTTREVQRTHGL